MNQRSTINTVAVLLLGLLALPLIITSNAHAGSFFAAQANGEITVAGVVIDGDGLPMPGVNVSIQGTTRGTATDLDGRYVLTTPADAVLLFSFIGYTDLEIPVEGRTEINVTLVEDVAALEEVVVVGYGVQRRQDLTGAVASIDESTLREVPAASIEQSMQARVPGMVITSTSAEPGGGLSIRIRGGNSISGNNEPLFVIDGFPMYNDNDAGAREFERFQSTNHLANLNPNDIESIEVLKDASATAIYGSRGANGVVIVTTKQGRAGRPRINFEHYSKMSDAVRTIPLANAYEYAQVLNMARETMGEDPLYSGKFGPADPETGEPIYLATPEEIRQTVGEGTDWQRELLRTGLAQNYQLGVSGGTGALTYNLSGNYFDEEGVLSSSGYTRYSLRANLFSQMTSKLSLRLNATGSRTIADRVLNANTRTVGGGPGRSGVIWMALRANPIASPDDWFYEGNPLLSTQLGGEGDIGFNPVMDSKNTHAFGYTTFLLANSTLEYNILDDLKFTSKVGVNLTENDKEWFWNRDTMLGYEFNGQAMEALSSSLDYLTENYFTYRKGVGSAHALDLTAGMSWQQTDGRQTIIQAQDYTLDFPNGIDRYEFAQMHDRHNSGHFQYSLLSYYGRATYNLLDRYLVTFTGRADGSSKFAKNNKWAFFPSGAIAWRFSEEPFLEGARNVLSDGKLRLSYGITGSQAIGPYGSLPRLRVDAFSWADGGLATGVAPLSPGNPDLRWESTEQFNAGLDLGFFDNRVALTTNVYTKTTRDLLQQLAVPAQTGFTTVVSNFGSIRNTGIELDLSVDVLDGPLTWSTSANYSTNETEVVDLGELDYILPRGFFPNPLGAAHIVEEGLPLGNFYGHRVVGLLTEEDIAAGYPTLGVYNTEGMFKFADEDGSGSITAADKVVLGNALPEHTFGWSNNFNYGSFGLSLFVQGMLGHQILNMSKMITEYGVQNFGTPSKDYMGDFWTPENRDAFFPRPAEFQREGAVITDRLVEDGSFVRLKSVTLSYNVPRLVPGVRNAQVYVTGTDLLTLTGYSGYDPEVSTLGQTNLEPGVDLGSYPRPRSFTIGVKLGF